METTLTLYLEGTTRKIEIPVTFSPVTGFYVTQDEPGETDHIEDIEFDETALISAVNELMESKEVDEWCMNEAEASDRAWQEDRAEFILSGRA